MNVYKNDMNKNVQRQLENQPKLSNRHRMFTNNAEIWRNHYMNQQYHTSKLVVEPR